VDPVYFDASYYLIPDGNAGDKPYHLLMRALEEEQHAALAKMVRSQREYLVIIRPARGGLTLHTLFYEDEVREVEEYGESEPVEVGKQELELARQFVQAMAVDFHPEKYHDSYREAVLELLEAKAKGQTLVTPEAPVAKPTSDLMAALKASLQMNKKPPKKSDAAEKVVAHPKQRAAKAKPSKKVSSSGRRKTG
jgi:DNA end-binding protein Ku